MARTRFQAGGASRRSFGPSGPKRLTEWAGMLITAPINLVGGTTNLVGELDQTDLAPLTPCTLIRVRGLLQFNHSSRTAGHDPNGAFSISIVKENARAIGITAIPSPVSDLGDDTFLCWEPWAVTFGGVEDPGMSRQYRIDCKAMRKIEDGDGLVVVAQNGAPAGENAEIIYALRFLFLFH